MEEGDSGGMKTVAGVCGTGSADHKTYHVSHMMRFTRCCLRVFACTTRCTPSPKLAPCSSWHRTSRHCSAAEEVAAAAGCQRAPDASVSLAQLKTFDVMRALREPSSTDAGWHAASGCVCMRIVAVRGLKLSAVMRRRHVQQPQQLQRQQWRWQPYAAPPHRFGAALTGAALPPAAAACCAPSAACRRLLKRFTSAGMHGGSFQSAAGRVMDAKREGGWSCTRRVHELMRRQQVHTERVWRLRAEDHTSVPACAPCCALFRISSCCCVNHERIVLLWTVGRHRRHRRCTAAGQVPTERAQEREPRS